MNDEEKEAYRGAAKKTVKEVQDHMQQVLKANRDLQETIINAIWQIQDDIDEGQRFEVAAQEKLQAIRERYENEMKAE